MLVGRLPTGMLSLAIVLRITGDGGSYRLAGGITAAYGLGLGAMSPLLSRLIDRRGQSVVLIPCGIGSLATAIVLALLPPDSAPIALILAGALLGTTLPPLSSTSRTIWPQLLEDPAVVESAYGVDATFQELIFMLGPLLVVAIAALAGTEWAIICAGALGCAGTLLFATSASSRSWRSAQHEGPPSKALQSPGIRILLITMFFLVGGFSAMEVAIIASARQAGAAGASGVLLAIWSLSSLVAGLVFGSRAWPGTLVERVVSLLGFTCALTVVLAFQHNLIAIAVVLAATGGGGAPSLASIYLTAQQAALPGVVTESYAWVSVGTLVGGAAGAAAAGQLITTYHAGAGFLLGAGGIAAAALTIALGRRYLQQP